MQTWHSTRLQTLRVRIAAADETRMMAGTLLSTASLGLGMGVDMIGASGLVKCVCS
jgi:hypothetical protein